MRIGMVLHFDSAHSIPNHPKCGVQHGHTYKVEIEIEGEQKEGMIMDFHVMKEEVKAVINELDHKDLNKIVELATVENITKHLHQKLLSKLPVVFLKVWEGEAKYASIGS